MEKFLLSLLIASCALLTTGQEFKEYESTNGGGDCKSASDCHDNGVCETNEDDSGKPQKLVCLCFENFDGEFCDKKVASNLQEIKGISKSSGRRNTVSHLKKQEVAGAKRELGSDKNAQATGLSPDALAETKMPFIIYNPKLEHYVLVSSDEAKGDVEKGNKYVTAYSEHRGDNRYFILEKVLEKGKEGLFYIKATDEKGTAKNGYLYVSEKIKIGTVGLFESFAVMMSKKKGSGKEYQFRFEENLQQKGIFSIVCSKQRLFVSSDHTFIGMQFHNMLEADKEDRKADETIWFQFSITEAIEYEEKGVSKDNGKVTQKNPVIFKQKKFENKDDSEKKLNYKAKTKTKTRTEVKKTSGITIKASAGFKPVGVDVGLDGTYKTEEEKKNMKEKEEKNSYDIPIVIPPKKIYCLIYKKQQKTITEEHEAVVKTKTTKKEFKVPYTVKVKSEEITFSFETVDLGKSCSHEKKNK